MSGGRMSGGRLSGGLMSGGLMSAHLGWFGGSIMKPIKGFHQLM